jgi:hypothetical protein
MKLGLIALLALACAGCPQAAASIVPDVALVECIVVDAAVKHAPIAQIATDCSADALAVITVLLAAKSPEVTSSPAHSEALARSADAGK